MTRSWLAVLPVQSADDSDLVLALEAVHAHRLPFWDAMLWASAQCAGVRHMLDNDFLRDGFELQDVTFINPFNPENNQLIDQAFLLQSLTEPGRRRSRR